MANSENDIPNSQTNKNTEESHRYEDEINLMDYFLVLWKRKYFIFLASVLPALIIGIVFFYLPRNYKVNYIYDVEPPSNGTWALNEKNYTLLVGRFYSEDNLSRLIDNLRKNGFETYARQLRNSSGQPKKLIGFEAIPPFTNLSKANTVSEQLERIKDIKASLLNIAIIGSPKKDIYKISSVIRDNIKDIFPLYMARDELSVRIKEYNNNLAVIERNKFSLEIALSDVNETLAKFKKINTGTPGERLDNVVLQFNVGEQSQYLPLSYQIQAVESKKINLEGNINLNEENYTYYKDLLDLNNKIFAELNNKLSSGYTAEQFKLFLTGLANVCEKPQLKDYLNFYIRQIENITSAGKPIIEKPEIFPIAKGTVRKSGIVFAIALMISVFAAFLLEGLEKNKARVL